MVDDARIKNVPPPLDLTRMIDRRKFPEKQVWPIPHEINGVYSLIGQKQQNIFQ